MSDPREITGLDIESLNDAGLLDRHAVQEEVPDSQGGAASERFGNSTGMLLGQSCHARFGEGRPPREKTAASAEEIALPK